MDIQKYIAKNLKEIRTGKHMTLDEASRHTGVSRSMLSSIEKGEVNPTISTLWKIASGYKVKFTSIMEDPNESFQVIRNADISPSVEAENGFINYPVFPFERDRLFETFRVCIEPGALKKSEPHLSGTEEYIIVFSGRVRIASGEISADLSEGDALHFKADTRHSYQNIGDERVWLSITLYYRPI